MRQRRASRRGRRRSTWAVGLLLLATSHLATASDAHTASNTVAPSSAAVVDVSVPAP